MIQKRARWLEERNAFCGAQPGVDGNQRKLEYFCGSSEKGVGGISVRKMNFAHGEHDFAGQRRFSRRKLNERPRDPFLDIHVQFDAALSDKDHTFPDADR